MADLNPVFQFNNKLTKSSCRNNILGNISHFSKFGSLRDDLAKNSVNRWPDSRLLAVSQKSFSVHLLNSEFVFGAEFMGFHSSLSSYYNATAELAHGIAREQYETCILCD
jgi:hypothetical protein